MDPRERFLTALACGTPDRVPVTESYINESSCVEVARILQPEAVHMTAGRDRFGEESTDMLDLYCLLVRELGLDATCTQFSIGLDVIGSDRGRDRFGTVYRLSEHGEPFPVEGPIRSAADLDGFDMASRISIEDFWRVGYVKDRTPGTAAILTITDPFKVSWQRRGGMEHLLADYVAEPDLAQGLARLSTDFLLRAVELGVEAGADAFIMTGDLAGEITTIMSPEHYRAFVKPYQAEVCARVHALGSQIIKHTDGNAWPILDDFVEVGFDAFHPVQPECMDIGEVKAHLAGRICVLGNIDCRNLLVFGTPEEVREAVRETIAVAGPGGGYVVTSSNSIHPAVQAANYVAMVRAVHEFGDYD